MKDRQRDTNTPAFFEWVQQHFGLWSLICTPGHEQMNPSSMVDLIEKLAKDNLDELIFVMLTVHRNEPFVAYFYRTMLFDLIAERWEDEQSVSHGSEHRIDGECQP